MEDNVTNIKDPLKDLVSSIDEELESEELKKISNEVKAIKKERIAAKKVLHNIDLRLATALEKAANELRCLKESSD